MGEYEVTAGSEQPMILRVCLSDVRTDQLLSPKRSDVGVFDVTCIRSIAIAVPSPPGAPSHHIFGTVWLYMAPSQYSKPLHSSIHTFGVNTNEKPPSIHLAYQMIKNQTKSGKTNLAARFQQRRLSLSSRTLGKVRPKEEFQRHAFYFK
ncbi:unnamed protein product [Larinioides sclopetarius]|uniref:Uncharacterized protein n=1 Tax=Larinioides sclopetarius TaxID=280406 RepID=A0AAV2BLG7_9ARAC